MRNLLLVFTLAFAAGALAGGFSLDPSVHYEFTNCSTDGGHAGQNIANGATYLVSVTDKDVLMCFGPNGPDGGANCIDGGIGGGMKLPLGSLYLQNFPGSKFTSTPISCYSSDGTGDLHLMKAY